MKLLIFHRIASVEITISKAVQYQTLLNNFPAALQIQFCCSQESSHGYKIISISFIKWEITATDKLSCLKSINPTTLSYRSQTGAGRGLGLMRRWGGKLPSNFSTCFSNLYTVKQHGLWLAEKLQQAKQRPLLTDILYTMWTGLQLNEKQAFQATVYAGFHVI